MALLTEEHYNYVLELAKKKLQVEDAKDIASKVVTRMLANETFDGDNLFAYLTTAVMNEVRGFYRLSWNKRVTTVAENFPWDQHLPPTELEIGRDELSEEILDAFSQLPEPLLTVASLYYLGGYGVDRIVELTETSRTKTYKRLNIAKAQLQTSLYQFARFCYGFPKKNEEKESETTV